MASPACKTNSNASWDPWRKPVAPLKLWYRRKIITTGYEQLSRRLVSLSGPRVMACQGPLHLSLPLLLVLCSRFTSHYTCLNFLRLHILCKVGRLTSLTTSELHHHQSRQEREPHPRPPQQSTIATPTIPDVAPQTQNPLLSTPETAAKVAQYSPGTPSKRESTKSIESYFMSAMQHVSRPANTDPASISDEPVQQPTDPDLE